MRDPLSQERLLAIIETQKEIVATELDIYAVMELVVRRARELTDASAAVIELTDDEQIVYDVGSGAAAGVPLSMLSVPLSHAGRRVGEIKIYDPLPDAFAAEDATTLDVLAGVITAHMAHARGIRPLQHGRPQDPLVALPTGNEFEDWLAAELARLRRHGGRMALCMLDLDRFDRTGDEERDAVLRAVAAHLDRLRGEDRVFRLQGDRFAVVLAETDIEGAGIAMRRISAAIDDDPACLGVGVSWGATALQNGDELRSIVERAIAALDDAKRALPR